MNPSTNLGKTRHEAAQGAGRMRLVPAGNDPSVYATTCWRNPPKSQERFGPTSVITSIELDT
ncbi:hypothetical protein Mapa_017443 [Marchantia paleacea]|nr:hypothetical protein Mapa_017443 [Marchantia paleacea]